MCDCNGHPALVRSRRRLETSSLDAEQVPYGMGARKRRTTSAGRPTVPGRIHEAHRSRGDRRRGRRRALFRCPPNHRVGDRLAGSLSQQVHQSRKASHEHRRIRSFRTELVRFLRKKSGKRVKGETEAVFPFQRLAKTLQLASAARIGKRGATGNRNPSSPWLRPEPGSRVNVTPAITQGAGVPGPVRSPMANRAYKARIRYATQRASQTLCPA